MPTYSLSYFDGVKWFSSVGKPIDKRINRIFSWNEWKGPESAGVELLNDEHQFFFEDKIECDTALSALFSETQSYILKSIEKYVTFPTDFDPWHPQSSAKWMGAFTGAMHRTLSSVDEIPDPIIEQWSWYEKGFWPCAYDDEVKGSEPKVTLLVY
ncbi:MAG: hypothetical protein MRY83_10045 [Flavobacteriales bacterium]|nr:hypothetical protein [Flavobacteriales bacterium]